MQPLRLDLPKPVLQLLWLLQLGQLATTVRPITRFCLFSVARGWLMCVGKNDLAPSISSFFLPLWLVFLFPMTANLFLTHRKARPTLSPFQKFYKVSLYRFQRWYQSGLWNPLFYRQLLDWSRALSGLAQKIRTLFSLSEVPAWYLKINAAPFLKTGVVHIGVVVDIGSVRRQAAKMEY